eukprot:g14077.t1
MWHFFTCISEGDQGISADSQLSLDDAFNFIMHVREKNGFTAGERQEFLKTFDHFCKANREMPTLQVMELLDWQGFKNRVEDADLHVPPRLVEDTFLKCVAEQGQVSAGITWDTWVKAAEQSRKLIPVENRKQASFTDAELQQLRTTSLEALSQKIQNHLTAFDLQSSDGCVSKGQLLWMLADSGMPVNKASGRRDLYLSLDRARRKALEAGVAEEEHQLKRLQQKTNRGH